jgi:hypothetical protein
MSRLQSSISVADIGAVTTMTTTTIREAITTTGTTEICREFGCNRDLAPGVSAGAFGRTQPIGDPADR